MSTPMQDISGVKVAAVTATTTTIPAKTTATPETYVHVYHVNDACLRCARQGHFSSACYAKKNKHGETIDSESEYNSE